MKKSRRIWALLLVLSFLLSTVLIDQGVQAKEESNGTWQKDSNGYYLVLPSGDIVKKNWWFISGKGYYLDSKGYRVTGWQQIGKKKYYFNKSGVAVTGVKKISGKKYYFNPKGAIQTGWRVIKGKKYYFNANGVMQTGWKNISGKKYYFGKNGVMVKGVQKIGKAKYLFDDKGACVKRFALSKNHKHQWKNRVITTKVAWDEKVCTKDAWDEQVPRYDTVYGVVYTCMGCGRELGRDVCPSGACPSCGSGECAGYTYSKREIVGYDTVHHDAEYKTVHHKAVKHSETYCKTCGKTK